MFPFGSLAVFMDRQAIDNVDSFAVVISCDHTEALFVEKTISPCPILGSEMTSLQCRRNCSTSPETVQRETWKFF
ncbi:hypothetical protein I7I53_00585 [Histoplasma capsulatum var. duboisii H88]|uniref:Uncharacterized protein n=1 Tax=Ajellomyces capsulatus (strain H88) TaxID=544711 RepID=A0A8A1LIN9_AJEC8|nr:hypothetical protein I7I53_00585 [Histoplasma capsulatum var. duboisii H88]